MATQSQSLQQRPSGSYAVVKQPSTRPLTPNELAAPATERQRAVELEKLRAVFGYEEAAWRTAAPIYIDALVDLPYDLLKDAVSTYIAKAGSDTRFPKPGELRSLAGERLRSRQEARRLYNNPAEAEWPKWLENIWGAAPLGPRLRAAAIEATKQRNAETNKRLAQVGALVREGLGQTRAWEAWTNGCRAGDGKPRPSATSRKAEMQTVHEALGTAAAA